MLGRPLHTVVETPEFQRQARGVLTEAEREELIKFLAANPDAGETITGTGGARKVRWAAGNKGKRGSARVITFFSGQPIPVFLLTVFGKGEKVNLTQGEKNTLKKVLAELVKEYLEGVKEHVQGR